MDRYDMLTELNAYRQSRDVQDLFHAVMGMAGRLIEAQTEIVRLQARLDDLQSRMAFVVANVEQAAEKRVALDTRVDELESRSIRRIEMLEDAVFAASKPAPAPTPETRGLYGKYRIFKADTGNPVEGDYFVLKLTDRAARAALRTYARVVERENPQLAEDILGQVAVHAYTGDDMGDTPAPTPEAVTISKAAWDAALGKLTDIIERGQWWVAQEAANAYELLTGTHPSVQSAGPFPVKSDDPGI